MRRALSWRSPLPGHRDGFEVLELEAPKSLVLGAHFGYPAVSGLPWEAPAPPRFTRATWTFVLEAVEGGRTRLLVRTRGMSRPCWLGALMGLIIGPAHAIMQRRQLLNLKARAEAGTIS